MKKIQISQSLIKDLEKFFAGKQCGHLVYEKYVHGVLTDPSDAMALGQYFEWKATGQLPKGDKEPQPVTLKKGELSIDYQRAENNAETFKTLCEKMGIEITGTGETISKNGMVGTRDVAAIWNGRKITIDLKYSGLIDDVWNEMGWGDLYGGNDRGKQYAYHSIQALQYRYLFGDDFFFWVWHPKQEGVNILIEMAVDETELLEHEERAIEAARRWNTLSILDRAGTSAIPEFNECKKCVIGYRCGHKTFVPIPKKVSLTNQ